MRRTVPSTCKNLRKVFENHLHITLGERDSKTRSENTLEAPEGTGWEKKRKTGTEEKPPRDGGGGLKILQREKGQKTTKKILYFNTSWNKYRNISTTSCF